MSKILRAARILIASVLFAVWTLLLAFNQAVTAQEPLPGSGSAAASAPALPSCSVVLVDPTQSGADSEKIIEMLKGITRTLADHNFEAMSKYMDENCSTYNEKTKKLVTGRENIIASVRAAVTAEEQRLKVPPMSFTVDHPFVKVSGETATVNFVLIKQIGGKHPAKYESHCTDVFVKHGSDWKKLLFRGDDWKLVK